MFAFSAPGEPPTPSLNTRGTSSDVRHDVKTHAIVSEIHREVADTRAIVSDIHHKMLESQEGTGSEHRSVSVTRTSSANTHLPFRRLKIGQRSLLPSGTAPHTCG